MQRHGGSSIAYSVAQKMKGACINPPDHEHPEDQVKFVKNIIKSDDVDVDMILPTNSLTLVYALNNELLRNPKLKVMAYEILPSGKKIKAIKKHDGKLWIDESILGHVGDALSAEMNWLINK